MNTQVNQRKLSDPLCEELASHLEAAERNAEAVDKVTERHPEMTLADAYEIQWRARAIKERAGPRIVGMKMGLTSRAKMEQMGVPSPCYGYLADYFACAEGEPIDTQRLIHPRVEAEIAVVTKTELRAPLHAGDVIRAIDFIVPAVEVIDSRYRNFKFDLPSVVADNTSSTRYVLGSVSRRLDGLDLRTLGVVMEKNGEVVHTGAGAAVLGHPLESVAELARMVAARGASIPTGSLILTGGITAAIAVAAGDCITVRYQELGSVTLRFA